MTTKGWMRSGTLAVALAMLGAAVAHGAPLTVEDAVKVALEKSSQMIFAEAAIKDAKGGVQSGYGGVIPTLSLSYQRSDSRNYHTAESQYIGGAPRPNPLYDGESRSTVPSVTVGWGILDLSNWASLSAAKKGMEASKLSRNAARADVALATRRQFYLVVQSIKLADVAQRALKLSRDDERRVKAMFEVGSVSKSDLLKAQVRTAQSELDSITSGHAITVQRVSLATQMGIRESELGEVDTLLVATEQSYDEKALLAEAELNRPDLMAARADMKSAEASFKAARMARLPYITAGGQFFFNTSSKNTNTAVGSPTSDSFTNETEQQLTARLSLNWDLFNLAAIDSRISSAHARMDRARDNYNVLARNLESEVHQQLLAYNEATEGNKVAQRGLESALENMKLTREKYNVGSSTILDLIDAQVQLETAASNLVKALAAIRVAEAQINRVRGKAE
jgi:outer membrane protein